MLVRSISSMDAATILVAMLQIYFFSNILVHIFLSMIPFTSLLPSRMLNVSLFPEG
jgi:hypothetical protein